MTVPTGLIAIWSGTLANIPANWSLCDGSGGTPNLVARFVRGAAVGGDVGNIGGADSHTHSSMTAAGAHSHTLASQSHSHTVNAAGSHSHGGPTAYAAAHWTLLSLTTGSHVHTTSSEGHTHSTSAAPTHTHTIDAKDGRPPYYEVAFIQAGAGASITAGIIVIWTGTIANIPSGWVLCDGGDSRPDLRSRFLRGVNTSVTNPGTTGGATTHNHNLQAAGSHDHGGSSNSGGTHSHTHSAYTWTHNHNTNRYQYAGPSVRYQTDSAAGNHTHSTTDSIGSHSHTLSSGGSHTHTCETASSLPAYYTVAYIIATSATSMPIGGILVWTGTIGNIPSGYEWCDGGDSRPNLKGKFLYGAATGNDPGGTGGSDTHTHTEAGDAGAHNDHTQGTAGAHQHLNTDTIGAHTHASGGRQTYSGSYNAQNNSAGAHAHTFNSENDHTHSSLDTQGAHNHEPWSTDNGRPAYYEVAFVIYEGVAHSRSSFFLMFAPM